MFTTATQMVQLGCIVNMCSQNTFLNTLKLYVCYVAVALLPNFVELGLSPGNVAREVTPDLI